MKTIVYYYSHKGSNRFLAQRMASDLACDIEEIMSWFTYFAWFFPPYWIAAIIKSPNSLFEISMAIVVHLVWLLVLVQKYLKQQS